MSSPQRSWLVGLRRRLIVGFAASRRAWASVTAIVVVSVVSLILRARVPLLPTRIPGYQYDTGLFERGSANLVTHPWFGTWDWLTLSKGLGYPAFIALMRKLGVPLTFGEQFTVLLGALGVCCAVWMVTRRRVVAVVVFTVVALDPANFNVINEYVLRDGWYGALCLVFISWLFVAVYGAVRRTSLALVIGAGLLAGISGSSVWLTREEGVWIVPSALAVALMLPLARVFRWWRRRRGTVSRRQQAVWAARVATAAIVIVTALYAPIAFVSYENKQYYGVAITNDMTAGTFPRAYADWSRVRAGRLRNYVPISISQRAAVYQVSEAARELRPFLEDPNNPWIAGGGCLDVHICDDFTGGWAAWALRSAAMDSGNLSSEPAMQAFFGRLDNEINAACKNHTLTCASQLPASIQPLQRVQLGPTWNSFTTWTGRTLWSAGNYALLSGPHDIPPMTNIQRSEIAVGVSGVPPTTAAANAQATAFANNKWPYRILIDVYRPGLPILVVVGLIGWLLGMRPPARDKWAMWVLAAALLAGAVGRLVMFAVIDASQYHIGLRYLLASRTFLLAFGLLGSIYVAHEVRSRVEAQRLRSVDAATTDPPCPPALPPAAADDGEVALTQ